MRKRVPKKIESILKEAGKELKKIYGDRLKKVILYGSYARGDATEGSDIDLLVILDDMNDPILELEKYSEEIHRRGFMHDEVISVIPIDSKHYETRRLPLILNAKREGIVI